MKTDLPGDLGPREPGLDQLLRALTAGPSRDELAGEPAALAMFRASQPRAAAAPASPAASPAAPARPRARPARPRTRRLAVAAALALALAGGFVAAAYTAALPAPVQNAAYRVLGFAGVPGARRPASRSPRPGPAARPPGGPGKPAAHPRLPGQPGAAAPGPGSTHPAAPLAPAQLVIAVARHLIVAGGSDSMTGLLTDEQGGAVAGQQLTLLERAAGSTTWQPAGQAVTGSGGSAVLTVQDLTANAWFRLDGPGGTQSRPVLVIAVPPVSVTVAAGQPPGDDTLTASSPLADPADLAVLQVRVGVRWLSVRSQQLGPAGQAAFAVKIRLFRQVFRVALAATVTQGASASGPVVIPPGG